MPKTDIANTTKTILILLIWDMTKANQLIKYWYCRFWYQKHTSNINTDISN